MVTRRALLEMALALAALWYHDLYFRWRRGPAAIAGMTGEDSLFCLDLLARDAGLRVLDVGDPADGLVSWVIGPKCARARAG